MKTKVVPLKHLRAEEGSEDMVKSEAMKPYLNLVMSTVRQRNVDEAMQQIRALPLEDRYVWRVASAMKWAFADCDGESAEADRDTMSPVELAKVRELLSLRPAQFCIILKALFGEREMLRMMMSGIEMARQAP